MLFACLFPTNLEASLEIPHSAVESGPSISHPIHNRWIALKKPNLSHRLLGTVFQNLLLRNNTRPNTSACHHASHSVYSRCYLLLHRQKTTILLGWSPCGDFVINIRSAVPRRYLLSFVNQFTTFLNTQMSKGAAPNAQRKGQATPPSQSWA